MANELKNVTVQTALRYADGYDECGNVQYYIELSIPIPGGKAVYLIPTSKEINDSLTAASKLSEQK